MKVSKIKLCIIQIRVLLIINIIIIVNSLNQVQDRMEKFSNNLDHYSTWHNIQRHIILFIVLTIKI